VPPAEPLELGGEPVGLEAPLEDEDIGVDEPALVTTGLPLAESAPDDTVPASDVIIAMSQIISQGLKRKLWSCQTASSTFIKS
jgi:hypothetical protein